MDYVVNNYIHNKQENDSHRNGLTFGYSFMIYSVISNLQLVVIFDHIKGDRVFKNLIDCLTCSCESCFSNSMINRT